MKSKCHGWTTQTLIHLATTIWQPRSLRVLASDKPSLLAWCSIGPMASTKTPMLLIYSAKWWLIYPEGIISSRAFALILYNLSFTIVFSTIQIMHSVAFLGALALGAKVSHSWCPFWDSPAPLVNPTSVGFLVPLREVPVSIVSFSLVCSIWYCTCSLRWRCVNAQ